MTSLIPILRASIAYERAKKARAMLTRYDQWKLDNPYPLSDTPEDRLGDELADVGAKLEKLTGAKLADHEVSGTLPGGKHELSLRFTGSLSELAMLVCKLGS